MMLSDVRDHDPGEGSWQVQIADARSLPDPKGTYTAVITSPPYPNRHDYTRVFGVELLFEFLDWERLRMLRYQSFTPTRRRGRYGRLLTGTNPRAL